MKINLGLLIAVALLAPACANSAVGSGVAFARVGQSLSQHSAVVPQGAQVCAMQEALATPQGAEKPVSETCTKAMKSDRLWRVSMQVMSAWSHRVEALARGEKKETAGQLDAAMIGIQDPNWSDADGANEAAARDAVNQLLAQMDAGEKSGDLTKTIKDAGPHLKTLCDGLGTYLDTQVKAATDIQKELEKKRATRADRRYAQLDSKPIAVSESVVDRFVYANAYSQLSGIEYSHTQARDSLSAFCSAYGKMQGAADQNNVSSDATYTEVVKAVKTAPRSQPPAAGPAGSAAAAPSEPVKPPESVFKK